MTKITLATIQEQIDRIVAQTEAERNMLHPDHVRAHLNLKEALKKTYTPQTNEIAAAMALAIDPTEPRLPASRVYEVITRNASVDLKTLSQGGKLAAMDAAAMGDRTTRTLLKDLRLSRLSVEKIEEWKRAMIHLRWTTNLAPNPNEWVWSTPTSMGSPAANLWVSTTIP